jgi:hypothetical protein
MSGVFQNIDPPTTSPPGECEPPAIGAGGGHTRWVERGWGANILEDARHCSVLYIRKYFMKESQAGCLYMYVHYIHYIRTFHLHSQFHRSTGPHMFNLILLQ